MTITKDLRFNKGIELDTTKSQIKSPLKVSVARKPDKKTPEDPRYKRTDLPKEDRGKI